MSKFNDFQEQFLVHSDITYLDTVVNRNDLEYNVFALKSTWTEFGLAVPAFSGVRRGSPVQYVHPGVETADWVWPWDIAYFIRDVGADFIAAVTSAPKTIYDFWTILNDAGISQDVARQIVHNDLATWRAFFSRLGNHALFIELRPAWARVCRFLAGEEPSPGTREELAAEPALDRDDRILALVAEIATALGLIIGATVGLIGFLIGVISAAAAVSVGSFGVLALPVVIAAMVIIHLAILGWVISVALAIVYLVMKGLLIFGSGGAVAASDLAHPFAGRTPALAGA
jgi:hypothetical protein